MSYVLSVLLETEEESDTPFSDRLENHHEYFDATSNIHHPDGGGAGWLLHNGRMIDIGGDSHRLSAKKVGGHHEDDLYDEGAARIYATPSHHGEGSLGIEINQRPSRSQISTLVRAARGRSYHAFHIEGGRSTDNDGAPITGRHVLDTIDRQWKPKGQ
jgi:hypothetical protein